MLMSAKYQSPLKCLEKARDEISGFASERFLALDANTPIARIFGQGRICGWFRVARYASLLNLQAASGRPGELSPATLFVQV